MSLRICGLVEEDGNLYPTVSQVDEPGRGLGRTAMRTQHILMYGLNLSPILAHFQKMPMNLPPCQPRRTFRELSHSVPVLISVHDAWCKVVNVCARAYEQQEDKEEGLEVEEGGLDSLVCRSNNERAIFVPF